MSSDHYNPNSGPNNSAQGWQYSSNGGSGSHRPPANSGRTKWWHWVLMAFFWVSGIWPFAIVMLVWNLKHLSKPQKENFRHNVHTAAEATRDAANSIRSEVNNIRKTATEAKQESAKPRQETSKSFSYAASGTPRGYNGKKIKGGTALMVLGIIFAASLGFSALMCLINYVPSGAFTLGILTLASLVMMGGGIKLNRRKERMINYMAYIGTNREVGLANMAASCGVPIKTLCKDLRKMLAEGLLPTGYLDLAAGKLFLTESGYRVHEEKPAAEEKKPHTEVQADDSILKEIRQVNDAIPDQVMSAKIDRIEEITGKILAYQKSHPDKAGQLRSFLNYDLPTTLKILRAYAQLDAQGIEGENISAAKARIEGMMDQVVVGFEKQLDKLFHDEAMDITSDVKVLENMLKKDGLSDDQQTMTMTF